MSEPGPESIPTSADPRSKRPTKRRALTPVSSQASQIESLFRDPDKEVRLPPVSKQRTSANLPAPPEIVANVQGSSAGAGSGEFHVYKASRRREYERLRLMDEEVEREKGDKEWEAKREEARRKDEERTEKNRRKREKKKKAAAASSKAHGDENGNGNQNHGNTGNNEDKGGGKDGGGKNGKTGREGQEEMMAVDGQSRPGAQSKPDALDGETDAQMAPVDEVQGVIIHDDD